MRCTRLVSWSILLIVFAPVFVSVKNMETGAKYVSVDFEIFGNVQGVCFRMYTEDEGKKRGVNGWVKNTRQGTVIGQVQGPHDKVSQMKQWLSRVGSPSSRIDRAEFSNEREISKLEIRGFGTRY